MIFQSCSYTLKRVKTDSGKRIWTKTYKDYEVGERKRTQSNFKYWYHEQNYLKYSGNISNDTTHSTTFIMFDSVRVYLFGKTSKYKSVFNSGLVSGQMLYCAMDSSCKPYGNLFELTDSKTGEPIVQDLWGWTGHTIIIDYFEELDYVRCKPTQRRFKFWVYPYKIRFNGANNIFLLELTNDKADSKTDIETFIKGARVTFVKKAWMMM